jgi:hypothetical protein
VSPYTTASSEMDRCSTMLLSKASPTVDLTSKMPFAMDRVDTLNVVRHHRSLPIRSIKHFPPLDLLEFATVVTRTP